MTSQLQRIGGHALFERGEFLRGARRFRRSEPRAEPPGKVGIGTLAFAFGIGPAVEFSFALLSRSPLARRSATEVDITFGNPAE